MNQKVTQTCLKQGNHNVLTKFATGQKYQTYILQKVTLVREPEYNRATYYMTKYNTTYKLGDKMRTSAGIGG